MNTSLDQAAPPRSRPRVRLVPRGASRLSWLTLLNTWITWALNVVTFTMLYNLGALIIEEFHLSPAAWGWLIAGYLGMRVVFDLPLTILSDRLGNGWRRRTVWFPVMIVYSILAALVAVPGLTDTLLGLFLLLAGIALGTTASEAIGVVATVEWWPREHRGFAVGLHHTGYPIGAMLGGFFTSWVLSTFGEDSWRYAYLIGLATLPFAVWYWFLSRRHNFETVTRETLARGLTPSVAETHDKVTVRSCLEVLRNRSVLIVAACALLFQAMQNVFQSSYPQYLKFVGGYSFATVASLSVLWGITGAFFQYLWPTLTDAIGRKWFILFAGAIQALVFVLLPVSTSLFGIVAVQLLYGVTLNAVFPVLFSTASDIGGRRTGSVLGVVFTALWLGGVAGSLLASQVLERNGGFANAGAYYIVYGIMVGFSLLIIVLRAFAPETNPVRRAVTGRVGVR
ncbi:MFS transporter [Xylanimonas ulmi]|uniref:Putative MFS family arabinose efflux permease n=1 Tax=Xylanimonas ulmi TaxID=228973 RepID=A0A4Q7M8E7_9MICO|nr:MFS transporter [Xylanibacterium ulmi]RZS62978.1 putative MFS family arabinose efflux permease [Xylanibacterium ulmi]